MSAEMIDHPPHYTAHQSGVECIELTEHLSFCLGNAVKYLWRAPLKGGAEDIAKACWYLRREADRIDTMNGEAPVCSRRLRRPLLDALAIERPRSPLGRLLSAMSAFGVGDSEELRRVADDLAALGLRGGT